MTGRKDPKNSCRGIEQVQEAKSGKKTVSFLEIDPEKILEHSQSAIERDSGIGINFKVRNHCFVSNIASLINEDDRNETLHHRFLKSVKFKINTTSLANANFPVRFILQQVYLATAHGQLCHGLKVSPILYQSDLRICKQRGHKFPLVANATFIQNYY